MTQAKLNSKKAANLILSLRMRSCLRRGGTLAATIGLLGTIVPEVQAQVPISVLDAPFATGSTRTIQTQIANPASTNTGSYGAAPYTAGQNISIDFGLTASNERLVNTFSTGTGVTAKKYNFGGLVSDIYIRRNNTIFTNLNRQLGFFEKQSMTGMVSSYAPDMESILRNQAINRGTDNTFSNKDNTAGNNNNIERIDFVSPGGISVPPASQIGDIGFLILERNGNDTVKIAAILSVDGLGNPTSYGPVLSSSTWGKVGPSISYSVMRKDVSDADWRPSDANPSQVISGIYFSFGSLMPTSGPVPTIYGYSIFPADVNSTGTALLDWLTYSTTTTESASGLDLMAGGGVFVTHTISGTVFSDPNGSKVQDLPSEAGPTAGIDTLKAVLLDSTGKVLQVVSVNADGTYKFSGIATPVAGSPYTVLVTTTPPALNATSITMTLPPGFVSTGENKGNTPDAAIDTRVTVSKEDFTTVLGQPLLTEAVKINFGIEQLPTAKTTTITSQTNPGGTTSVAVPITAFNTSNDPDGTVDRYRITAFPTNATSIEIDGVIYTVTAQPGTTAFPTGGVTVLATKLNTIKVDPVDGAINVTIPFKAIDNAGQESANTANAVVPFTQAISTVSGNVFNDLSGNKLQDGTEPLVNGSTLALNAVLFDVTSNKVYAVTAVSATGTYTFGNVVPGNYTVILTTATAAVSGPIPTVTLPTNWTTTGENLSGTVETTPATPDSKIAITVAAANITNLNFGIEQLPTAIGATATSQSNPTGTNSVAVPITLFNTSSDPDTGTVDKYRITSFPTNATSITIDGVTYTALGGSGTTAFPAGGVTVDKAKLNTITVDPIDGAVTVDISFKAIDNAGQESSNTAISKLPFTQATYGLSGTVFNDVSGNKLKDGTEPFVDGVTQSLRAVLLDSNNQVVKTVSVTATGTYDFGKVIPGNYTIVLTTTAATLANPIVLPTGWATTGENIGGTIDPTADSTIAVSIVASDSTANNFGIEQLPTATGASDTPRPNPGGTTSLPVSPTVFDSSDPAGGTVDKYRITLFPANATSFTITQAGVTTTYTSANFPAAGLTILSAELSTLKVDPNVDGAISVTIPFKAIDNAGKESTTTGTAIVPFGASLVSVSGTVFDDGNGNKLQAAPEGSVDGTALGLKAVLVSNNQVIATVPVSATGTYTFAGVAPGNYSVLITTNTPVGTTPPAIALPTNWITTGENLGGTIENTPDSQQSIAVGSTAITGVNFGIEQLPIAKGATATPQPNPRNAVSVDVPPALFNTSTDADGTVDQYRITSFPSNATSITIDGIIYTAVAGPGTTAFPPGGVTIPAAKLNTIKVDPNVDGVVSVTIPFTVIDNFGKESTNTANAIVPFTAGNTPELTLLKRITKINGLTTGKTISGAPIDLTAVVAQPDNPATARNESGDASNPNWPTANYPKGAIDAGAIKSGDTIEYTIYFLSVGSDPVKNANFCDWVPKNTTFVPDLMG
jgi:SdrD B-like domain